MILEKLEIERKRWGPQEGQLVGAIKFISPNGEVSLNLTQPHIQKILEICADSLIVISQEVAKELTAQVIEQAHVKVLSKSDK